jgi:hypothetical protein
VGQQCYQVPPCTNAFPLQASIRNNKTNKTMTKIEQAHHLIENLQIAEFFTFIRNNAKPNALLVRLESAFVQGRTDVDFYEQLKTLANVLLSESSPTDKITKDKPSITQTAEKIYNIENINGDANFS